MVLRHTAKTIKIKAIQVWKWVSNTQQVKARLCRKRASKQGDSGAEQGLLPPLEGQVDRVVVMKMMQTVATSKERGSVS